MNTLYEAVYSNALDLTDVKVGDIGIAHTKGFFGLLIRIGTRSKWNHAFVVVLVPKNPTAQTIRVIQATPRGVIASALDEVAPGGYFAILPCPTGVSRRVVVAQAILLRRDKYAFVSILSIAFNFIPLPIRLNLYQSSTLICSAVCAVSLHAGGWLYPWPDMYSVTPKQLAAALTTER